MFGEATLSPTKISDIPKVWENDAYDPIRDDNESEPIFVSATLEGEYVPIDEHYATLLDELEELQEGLALGDGAVGASPQRRLRRERGVAAGQGGPGSLPSRALFPAGAVDGAVPIVAKGLQPISGPEYFARLQSLRRRSQIFYEVAPEVHREVRWDEVPDVDPREYTHCRYTPVLTEDARDFDKDGYTLRVSERGHASADAHDGAGPFGDARPASYVGGKSCSLDLRAPGGSYGLDSRASGSALTSGISSSSSAAGGSDGGVALAPAGSGPIRLLICVTIYNEDEVTLNKTLTGICENLEGLYEQYSRDGDEHGLDWRQVAVVVVQDGRDKQHESVTAAATVGGYYSSNVIQDECLGLPVAMHVFEYTTRLKKHAGIDCYPPLQVVWATKGENRGKLDSHCWFFDAFAHHLRPEFCVLFDAGTRPLPSALRNLYAHMRRYPDCGGATGDLTVERPYRNYLTCVQYMEWKIAHFLSKPIESLCGYLTVLPGAFSAFRWEAIEGEPLRRYFYGLYSQADLTAFEANMYLAEDRILCLEIVAKKGAKYYLEYVKEAAAEADPVTSLPGLVKQRRRWLNGTFFAMLYTLGNWGRIWKESHHGIGRKMALSCEFVYLTFLTITGTWFGIGIMYTMMDQLFKYVFRSSDALLQIGELFTLIYLILIVIQLVANLKNKPETMGTLHLFTVCFFMLYMCAFTGITIWYLSGYSIGEIMGNITQLGVLMVFGSIFLAAALHGDGAALAGAGVQYWIMQPVFYNVLQLHAFCNTDDISWGTKNLDSAREASRAKGIRGTRGLLLSGNAGGAGSKRASKGADGASPADDARAERLRPNESRESRAFWNALSRVHERLTDPRARAAHAAIKEQKLKAFATYLLLAWVITNMLLAYVVGVLAALSWEKCTSMPAATYGRQLAEKANSDSANAEALGTVVAAASALLTVSSDSYPFGGLPNFPSAYPVLLAGSAQSNASRGEDVTVLAPSRDVFSALPDALPSYADWVNASAGVNVTNATAALSTLDALSITSATLSGSSTTVECKTHYGRTYYLTFQFVFLCMLIGAQSIGSIVFIFRHYWRRLAWRRRNERAKRAVRALARSGDKSGLGATLDGTSLDGTSLDGEQADGSGSARGSARAPGVASRLGLRRHRDE